ncbi:arabinose efflux permease family protein [Saccharomonospora marina XMU15]|uniref:Arabinose efflux permease family protein n=1 Tax=Saccharomonospora marina XMU15 TaxID=882083 RepID=H5X6N2_9PSEU|nr:MFS transporter [Saccharomonospora marina]EHR51253.1 arabinose efflux permease family protein [Saccharomonospora marina XMU15]
MTSVQAPPRRWVSLAGICSAAGIVWLAFSDFGVAIPRIADEFGTDLSPLQWANNAFSLVTGALVIAAGKFGDLFGRRLMLQLGSLLLAGFSVLAALAPSVEWLIVGRGLMGVGAALVLPASLALIPPEFSGRAEITAFGIWQAVAWGGLSLGPAIGGGLTDGLGWRWLFWINLPLAAVSVAVVRLTTPESRDTAVSRHVDWWGLATIASAVFALLYALTEGPVLGWASPPVLALFGATLALAAAWYQIERRSRAPLVDLRLFRLRAYNGALTANLTMNVTFAGLSFVLVLWLQNALGYDPVRAGMLLLPATVGVFAFIPLGGKLDATVGGRLPSVAGLTVAAAGLVVLGLLGTGGTLWPLALALFVIGLGLGLVSTPVANTAVGEVPGHLAGTAAGVFKMSSMLGGALGVAILTALARGLTSADAASAFAAANLGPAEIAEAKQALVNSSTFQQAIAALPAEDRRGVADAVTEAFTFGVAGTMIATAVLTAVAAVAVLLLWPAGSRRRGGRA